MCLDIKVPPRAPFHQHKVNHTSSVDRIYTRLGNSVAAPPGVEGVPQAAQPALALGYSEDGAGHLCVRAKLQLCHFLSPWVKERSCMCSVSTTRGGGSSQQQHRGSAI